MHCIDSRPFAAGSLVLGIEAEFMDAAGPPMLGGGFPHFTRGRHGYSSSAKTAAWLERDKAWTGCADKSGVIAWRVR